MRCGIGVDIGGTKIGVGICDTNGSVVGRNVRPTGEPEAIIDQIRELIQQTGISISEIDGIGVGSVGPLDIERGRITQPVNIPHWHEIPIVALLSETFSLPVRLDNDANAAALAEARFGNRFEHFVYLTLSTGIGGGIVVNGRLYRGARGNAAEVGHMILVPDGPRCNCGKRGCLEALASGTAIGRRGQELLGLEQASAKLVFDRARSGDQKAKQIIDEAARYLGLGLANLMEIFNPNAIVVGGGMVKSWELFAKRVERTATAHAQINRAPIRPTELGDEIGILGAAALVWEPPRIAETGGHPR